MYSLPFFNLSSLKATNLGERVRLPKTVLINVADRWQMGIMEGAVKSS